MRQHVSAFFVAVLVAAVLAPVPAASAALDSEGDGPNWLPVQSHFDVLDAPCADVLFVGARGSGESFDGDGFGDPVAAVRDAVKESLDGDVTVRQAKIDYPAYPIQPRTDGDLMSLVGGLAHTLDYLTLSAAVGVAPDLSQMGYFSSIDAGTVSLLHVLDDSATRCPEQKLVLAGYSAGALVVHKALAASGADVAQVAAVALIADPGRDDAARITSAGFSGTASGEVGAVSVINSNPLFAPYTEFLATAVDPLPAEIRAKTYEICNQGDYVCDPGGYGVAELIDVLRSGGNTDTDAHVKYSHEPAVELLREAGARVAARVDGDVPGQVAIEALVSRDVKSIAQVGTIMRTSIAAADLTGNIHAVYGNGSGWFDYTPAGISWQSGDSRYIRTGLPGGTNNVNDIAFDQFGNVYSVFGRRPSGGSASDTRLHWAKYTPQGELVFSVEMPRETYTYTESNKIDVDANGRVYVSAIRGGLYKFNANGTLIGSPTCGGGGYDFAVRPDGGIHALVDAQMWSYSSAPDYVITCDSSGESSGLITLSTTRATNIDVDSRGNAYVGDATSLAVHRVASDGSTSMLPVPEVDWRAQLAVAVGNDSEVYATFVDPTDGTIRIVRFGYGVPMAFDVAPVPLISGVARAGRTLVADPGEWSPATVSLNYQWFRGFEPIPGAVAPEYLVSELDIGSTLRVEVSGQALGYLGTVRSSVPTAEVRPAVDPIPGARIEVVVDARCVAGKVVQTLTVNNTEAHNVSVAATGPFGTASVATIAPGRTTTMAVSTRQRSISAGSYTFTSHAVVDGVSGSEQQTTGYAAASCG